jgi:uncharacterized phage protein gp47/JayE
MAQAPQIALRDGSGFTTNLVFTTNRESITITGTISPDTAAMQIAVNGGAWVTDPTLIKLDLNTFTVPNPDNFPTGLLLDIGINVIQLRTIDIVGGVSATSTVAITRVSAIEVIGTQIPSGIRLDRNRNTVTLFAGFPQNNSAFDPAVQGSTLTFLGFNFYASTSPGGSTGYFKINDSPITAASSVTTEDVFQTAPIVALWDNSARKSLRVVVTEEDEFGNVLVERLNQQIDITTYIASSRFNATFESYQRNTFASFIHDRNGGVNIINSDQFASVANTDPLYYVATAIYFDKAINTEYETPLSQEVLGQPLIIDTTLIDLPGRTQLQIVTDYLTAISRVNAEVTLIPGSTTRDVSIDPFASEAERLWFILDFVHRSQSFLTLIQIDDVNGDGISDPVAGSTYKQAIKAALGFNSDTSVQNLVDQQFDKLANNDGTHRLPGRPSVGQVVFFTTVKPAVDIVIPAGTIVSTDADATTGAPSWSYRIGGSFILPAATADAFFNFDTKQYELTADVVATQLGSSGNRPAGTIKNISGVSGISVTNRAATVFGTDIELNSELATRAILAFTSVDTGTEGGYEYTSASTIGIVKALVVKSGDPLMMRDFDEVRHKHIGGKVDIWVQGLRERQLSEQFAFAFEIALNVQVQIIDLTNLIFRVLDSHVTLNTPIIEILNNPSQGLGVRNVTIGQDYDLTGVTILDYQTFQLNTGIPQPVTHIDDIINADYRYRVVNDFFFTFQPVRRVISVVGEVAGALDPANNFALYKTDDPLLTGESTIAQDFLAITQFNGKPSGNQITVNNEVHVLIGFVQEPLLSIGINTKTIRVFNELRTIEFLGPTSPVPDFVIIEGTATTPAKIQRAAGSTIANGLTVSVDYVHDENFTVTYVINDLLQELQQVVNKKRHETADVLVKQAVQNQVDIETTVQLKKGATKDNVDPLIRSNVSLILNQKLIGQGIAQSNVDAAINDTTGVDFNVLPMAKMAHADGSLKLREQILSAFVHMTSLDIGGNEVFIFSDALENPTTDGGGLATEPKGVYQDDEVMTPAASLAQVGLLSNGAFIIGSGGAIINGYTDDATLIAAGFTTAAAILAERLKRTANHVVVSLLASGGDNPDKHKYACSYVIRGDTGSHDITAAQVEFIDLGNFTITYRSAT